MDPTGKIVGLVVEKLLEFFSPDQALPPTGGPIQKVHVIAGDYITPPAWAIIDDEQSVGCTDCGDPYLCVRLARRWRTDRWPHETDDASCVTRRAITVEVGLFRCAAEETCSGDLELQAFVQWDDSWRIDMALCAAMGLAQNQGVATNTGLGPGEPFGPEGLLIGWMQSASAQV